MQVEVRGFESHLKQFFLFNTFLNVHCIVKVTNTELQDINRLMGYRDAQWYIKDTWIDFGVCYIEVFCKFPGWSLLWTTTMVHDIHTHTVKIIVISVCHSLITIDMNCEHNLEHFSWNLWALQHSIMGRKSIIGWCLTMMVVLHISINLM